MTEEPSQSTPPAAAAPAAARSVSLKQRIIAVVITLMLVPLMVAAYWTVQMIDAGQRKDNLIALDNAIDEARDVARFVERRAVTTTVLLSSHFIIEEFVRMSHGSEWGSRDQLLSITLGVLGDFKEVHLDHRVIGILGPRGSIDAAKGGEHILLQVINDTRRDAILKSPQYLEWLPCPGEISPCLLVVNPIYTRNTKSGRNEDRRGGYVATLVSSESFRNIGKRFEENFGGELHIIDDKGRDWFSDAESPALVSTDVAESDTVKRGDDEEHLRIAEVSDNLRIAGFLPVDNQQGSREFLSLISIIATIGVLACVVIVLLALQRYVFQPLTGLKNSADAMAAGNLQTAIPVLRKDEIGELGQALQQMQQRVISSNQQIRELAFTDALTGLQNRAMFTHLLDFMLQRSDKSIDRHALLFLDLDKFNQVNDSLNHGTGDELLRKFGARLTSVLTQFCRGHNTTCDFEIARFGGDEFQILLHNIESSEQAGAAAQHILDRLSDPFTINEHKIYAPASIGIAVYPDDGTDTENLIKFADIAMYYAKKSGGNNFKFYSDELNQRAVGKFDLQMRLRDAIKNGGLSLVFQPKIDVTSGALIGAEALCRWHDEKLGTVPPDRFIKAAETHGMIGALTEWLIDQACTQLNQWLPVAPPDFALAINASSQDVHGALLPGLLQKYMQQHDIHPRNLIIELTETGLIKSMYNPIENLQAIRNTGVRISLDDFGTGYSSLSYLRELPIDELKLDRSFLQGVPDETRARSIVKVVAELAKALDLNWTAEGVEHQEQLTLLQSMGCTYAQGYLLAKPLEADAFTALFDKPKEAPWQFFWKPKRRSKKTA